MTKEEFNEAIDNYTYRWFSIDDEVIIWNEYFIKELTPSLIQVWVMDTKEAKFRIKESVVEHRDLWYENGIELLFNHYRYWVSNDSNCFLANLSWQVLAVSYNGMKRNKVIFCDGKRLNPYVVLNREYKIDWFYWIDDLDKIISKILLPKDK